MPIPYRPVSAKVLINEAVAEQERLNTEAKRKNDERLIAEAEHFALNESAIRMIKKNTDRADKYTGFTETLRNTMMEYAISTMCTEAMSRVDSKLNNTVVGEISESTVHALTYEFIHENGGAASLLSKMRGHNGRTTYFLSELSNTFDKHFKAMLEKVDRNDPSTFCVSQEDMCKYKEDVKDDAFDEIADSIADRVVQAIGQFIDQNAMDKKNIVNALTATKEKIDSLDTDDAAVKESYAQLGKRYISTIRNKPKGLFTEMVHSMAEGVMKDQTLKEEFTSGAHLNMGKIISRVSLLYGFLESVSTMHLVKIDEAYMKDVLTSMQKY